MSFIKKIWKRGDKLTVKELNRIENGIAEGGSGNNVVVECDVNAEEGFGSNFSITGTEFTSLMENNIRITIKANIFVPDKETNILEQVGTLWTDASQIMDNSIMFYIVSDSQNIMYILGINENTGEIEFKPEN